MIISKAFTNIKPLCCGIVSVGRVVSVSIVTFSTLERRLERGTFERNSYSQRAKMPTEITAHKIIIPTRIFDVNPI